MGAVPEKKVIARRKLNKLHQDPRNDIGATAKPDSDFVGTVTVACKLPTGLIMKTWHMEEQREAAPGGSRTVLVAVPDPQVFRINGNAVPFGKIPDYPIIGGYALTPNIPRSFWERWLEQHKDTMFVQRRIVFAYSSPRDVEQAAKDNATILSGFEAINPDKSPIPGIKTATKND